MRHKSVALRLSILNMNEILRKDSNSFTKADFQCDLHKHNFQLQETIYVQKVVFF